jgi:hypothetical protein
VCKNFWSYRDNQSTDRAIENIIQEAAPYLVLFRLSCTILSKKSNDMNMVWLCLNIKRKKHSKNCARQK